MECILEIEDIVKTYGKLHAPHNALNGVSLKVYKHEFVSITGPSGSGKSTLLSILGLLDEPTSGKYMLASIDTTDLSIDQRTHIRNQHIGYVFQAFNLIDDMTVAKNISLTLSYRAKISESEVYERTLEAAQLVGMIDYLDYYPTQLSGGQQQRVAIARAIIGKPDLILLDEPTGNLDSNNGDQIMKLLEELNNNGSTIMMVTHDSRYMLCSNRQIRLQDGVLLTEQSMGN